MGKKKHRPPLPSTPVPVIDTHCHLEPRAFDTDDEVEAVIDRAVAAGVTGMITVGAGYGVQSARYATALAERHPDHVWCSVGIHPHDAAHWNADVRDEIRQLAARAGVVAMGEMGLDFHYDFAPPEVQIRVLEEQATLAVEIGMPIIVHDRESGGRTFQILRSLGAFDAVPVVFHCYSGTVEDLGPLVEAGGSISVGGVITFANAETLRDVVRTVPLDRLMLETDCPYLTPAGRRGRRNEPAFALFSLAFMAELRGMALDEFASRLTANARSFFSLPELTAQA